MEKDRRIEGEGDSIDKCDLSIMKSALVCMEECAPFSLSAVIDRFSRSIFHRSACVDTRRPAGRPQGAANWLVRLYMQS